MDLPDIFTTDPSESRIFIVNQVKNQTNYSNLKQVWRGISARRPYNFDTFNSIRHTSFTTFINIEWKLNSSGFLSMCRCFISSQFWHADSWKRKTRKNLRSGLYLLPSSTTGQEVLTARPARMGSMYSNTAIILLGMGLETDFCSSRSE